MGTLIVSFSALVGVVKKDLVVVVVEQDIMMLSSRVWTEQDMLVLRCWIA